MDLDYNSSEMQTDDMNKDSARESETSNNEMLSNIGSNTETKEVADNVCEKAEQLLGLVTNMVKHKTQKTTTSGLGFFQGPATDAPNVKVLTEFNDETKTIAASLSLEEQARPNIQNP